MSDAPGAPRVRRSLLFSPGHRGDMLRKALGTGADSVCLDLEDAVPPDAKDDARGEVLQVLDDRDASAGGPEVLVRVNPLAGFRWRGDLEATLPGAPDGVVLPKASSRDDVLLLDAHLRELEAEQGLEVGSTPVLPLLETPRGILHAQGIASAHPRVQGVLFGAEDLAAEVGSVRTREGTEVLVARSLVPLAAAAAPGPVQALDQVWADLEDHEGLREEARFARQLGYAGKMIIHPGQVAPVHDAFTPTSAEAERALRVVEAAEEAGIDEGGVVRFEGRMLERPIVEQARRVVRVARHAGLLDEVAGESTGGARGRGPSRASGDRNP